MVRSKLAWCPNDSRVGVLVVDCFDALLAPHIAVTAAWTAALVLGRHVVLPVRFAVLGARVVAVQDRCGSIASIESRESASSSFSETTGHVPNVDVVSIVAVCRVAVWSVTTACIPQKVLRRRRRTPYPRTDWQTCDRLRQTAI